MAFAVSPGVDLEYEDLLKRRGILGFRSWINHEEIDMVLDALFAKALLVSPYFRFRPFLDDPKDDLYVECAFAAGADTIITNDRHFRHPSVRVFGLAISTAGDFIAQQS